mmetsp:Transcript_135712/g.264158  ORF Transcript_135712/g.264158 Transcript_135712/m.264158 type:complete len:80 (+) Transcript_135712:99-338(+)
MRPIVNGSMPKPTNLCSSASAAEEANASPMLCYCVAVSADASSSEPQFFLLRSGRAAPTGAPCRQRQLLPGQGQRQQER